MKKIILVLTLLIGLNCLPTFAKGVYNPFLKTNKDQAYDIDKGFDFFRIFTYIRKYDSSEAEVLKTEDNKIIIGLDDTFYLIEESKPEKKSNFYIINSDKGYNVTELTKDEAVNLLSVGYNWIFKFED